MERDRYLKQLLDVIRVLRGSEADVAKKHLKAYETNHTLNMRKMFRLYKYIKIKQIHNYDKLKQKISPDSTDDSFNKLIRRTLDRVEESLIVDVNIRRQGAYSDLFRMKFFLRKQIMQGHILLGRGLKDRPIKILDNVIRYGKRYELYSEVLEALTLKQIVLSNAEGLVEFEKIGKQIETVENKLILFNEAKKIFSLYNAKGFSKSNSGVSDNELLKSKIELLKNSYRKTKSTNILSYYYLLKIDFEKAEQNISIVNKLTKEFIDLLIASPAVFSSARIIFLLNELARSEYSLLNFEQSLSIIEEGKVWSKDKELSYITRKILKFDNYILLKEYEFLNEEINDLADEPFLRKHPYHQARINYQKAIGCFGQNDYKLALNLFSEKNEIEKDKEGWNVWIRIMRILCSIELLRLNLIDYDVESFRKYLQRVSKQYEVRNRDQLILKILMELDKQNYNFEETAMQRSTELELLQSTDKATGWNPDSPELILFHDWFEAKRLKKDYQPNFERYRKAWNK